LREDLYRQIFGPPACRKRVLRSRFGCTWKRKKANREADERAKLAEV